MNYFNNNNYKVIDIRLESVESVESDDRRPAEALNLLHELQLLPLSEVTFHVPTAGGCFQSLAHQGPPPRQQRPQRLPLQVVNPQKGLTHVAAVSI